MIDIELDLGPLATLIGTWKGDRGMDVAPEKDGKEENPYYETIVFESAGDVDNAETQFLVYVRYNQVVRRKSNDEVFHDETGYWIWDAENRLVMQSFSIPRGVCVMAGGRYDGSVSGEISLNVEAGLKNPDWGIVQSPFMRDNAKATEFTHRIIVNGDRLTYTETTTVEIYGKTFEHTDQNELVRVH